MQAHGKWLFTGVENVKGHFLFDIAPVYEIEHPFRIAKHALYTRISSTKAVVLGWWRNSTDEQKHLLQALGGRVVRKEEQKDVRWTPALQVPASTTPVEDDPQQV